MIDQIYMEDVRVDGWVKQAQDFNPGGWYRSNVYFKLTHNVFLNPIKLWLSGSLLSLLLLRCCGFVNAVMCYFKSHWQSIDTVGYVWGRYL